MAEQLGNLGYLMIKKETTKGTPVIPNVGVPLFEESLSININLEDVDPIVGIKSARYAVLQGQRDYTGEVTVLGDPNIVGYFLDMLLTKTSTTGAGPYTHTFGLSTTTNPSSYTFDFAKGQAVFRFWGVEAKEIGIDFADNQARFPVQVSALGSFTVREIASVSTNVLTLKTDFSDTPTKGLVATDLVRLYLANGTVVDTTVTSVTATTVTVGSAAGVATGDLISLRKQTPSYTLAGYLQWAKTEFRFGANATAALSATHTPVESGSGWTVKHMFKQDEGEKRSGSFDPVSLVRTLGDAELKTRLFFDTMDEQNRFLTVTKRACVVRHFTGASNQYELRTTFNNIVQGENPVNLKSNDILFNDITWRSQYDTTDAQQFAVTVINSVSSI